jgi:hypothetical protein
LGIITNILHFFQLFNLVRRVRRNKENDLILIQYTVRLASSVSIAIATAVYLWGYEQDVYCAAPSSQGASDLVDVSKQFRDILKIWWTFAIVDVARCLIVFLAIGHQQLWLANVYYILSFNDLLGAAAIIILHDYRFKYPGTYCAGDYLNTIGA